MNITAIVEKMLNSNEVNKVVKLKRADYYIQKGVIKLLPLLFILGILPIVLRIIITDTLVIAIFTLMVTVFSLIDLIYSTIALFFHQYILRKRRKILKEYGILSEKEMINLRVAFFDYIYEMPTEDFSLKFKELNKIGEFLKF